MPLTKSQSKRKRNIIKFYTGNEVPRKYQKKYGKRYSKSEAEDVYYSIANKHKWKL